MAQAQSPSNLCEMSFLSTVFVLAFQVFLLGFLNFLDYMGLEIILVGKVNKFEYK